MNNIGVRAIIKTDNGLVMAEHNEKRNGKILIFPGGGMESGENIFQAIEREVKEETNLIVKPEKIIYIRETFYKGDSGIEFYVLCSFIGGNLSLGTDPELAEDQQVLQAVCKVSWDEIKDNKWYPEELHDRLENDLKIGNDNIIYLGVKDFS